MIVCVWRSEREIKAIRKALTKLQVDGRLANVACEGDGETHTAIPRNLQLCPISPELPIFRSLPLADKAATAVNQLLCADPKEGVHCYLSQTFWKPARHGLGTGWHQVRVPLCTESHRHSQRPSVRHRSDG